MTASLLRAFLLLTILCGTAVAGSAPYASLYRALEPGLKLEKYPRMRAVQRILSKLPAVAPETISVQINAASGAIRLPIGADGRVSFPLSAELLSENPTVESNQPGGSLSISVSFEIAPPSTTTLAYAEFRSILDEARAALQELEGPYSGAQVSGIEFRMGTGDANATVESPSSEDLLRADPLGRIVVSLDEHLDPGQTSIRFSTVPKQAFPHLRMPR